MTIDHIVLGAYQTNCYILKSTQATDQCIVIDTGLNTNKLLNFLTTHKLQPQLAVLTHGHADHTMGIPTLRQHYPSIKICIHRLDADMLSKPHENLSGLTGILFSTKPPDCTLEEASSINQAGITLKVLHTPGHTPGGICLYCEKEGVLFSGDTLFAGSVGRTDTPGGNMKQLIKSIKGKLFVLPQETTVYPGHGPSTTIGYEKANNPFVR